MKKTENPISKTEVHNSIFYHPPPKFLNSFHYQKKVSGTVQVQTISDHYSPIKVATAQKTPTKHKKNAKSFDVATPVYIVNNKKNYIIYNDIKISNASFIDAAPLIYSPPDSEKKQFKQNSTNKKSLNEHYKDLFQTFKFNNSPTNISNKLPIQTPCFRETAGVLTKNQTDTHFNNKINNLKPLFMGPSSQNKKIPEKFSENQSSNQKTLKKTLIKEEIEQSKENFQERTETVKMSKGLKTSSGYSTGEESQNTKITTTSKDIAKPKTQKIEKKRWDPNEDNQLKAAYKSYELLNDKKIKRWEYISELCQGRNASQCKQRYKRLIKPENVRKKWTDFEDKILKNAVEVEKLTSWEIIADRLKTQGFQRTGKQVRERYINHLDPNINFEEFRPEEDQLICEYFKVYGNKWSKIARHLTKRTENAVKNRFHYHLKKFIQNNDGKTNFSGEDASLMNKMETESFSDQELSDLNLNDAQIEEIFKISTDDKEGKFNKGFSAESVEAYKNLKNSKNSYEFEK